MNCLDRLRLKQNYQRIGKKTFIKKKRNNKKKRIRRESDKKTYNAKHQTTGMNEANETECLNKTCRN